jgi:hypothetical protein
MPSQIESQDHRLVLHEAYRRKPGSDYHFKSIILWKIYRLLDLRCFFHVSVFRIRVGIDKSLSVKCWLIHLFSGTSPVCTCLIKIPPRLCPINIRGRLSSYKILASCISVKRNCHKLVLVPSGFCHVSNAWFSLFKGFKPCTATISTAGFVLNPSSLEQPLAISLIGCHINISFNAEPFLEKGRRKVNLYSIESVTTKWRKEEHDKGTSSSAHSRFWSPALVRVTYHDSSHLSPKEGVALNHLADNDRYTQTISKPSFFWRAGSKNIWLSDCMWLQMIFSEAYVARFSRICCCLVGVTTPFGQFIAKYHVVLHNLEYYPLNSVPAPGRAEIWLGILCLAIRTKQMASRRPMKITWK